MTGNQRMPEADRRLEAFGIVPERGERVDVDGLRLEVLSAESRRLRMLRVFRVP